MTKVSIIPEITALEAMFDTFNHHLFNDELDRPVITFNTDTTQGAYGWVTTKPVWHDGDNSYFELNVSCDQIVSGTRVAETVLHEMVHLYNMKMGLKDVTRGGTYHNVHFKKSAERFGLIVSRNDKYGWLSDGLVESALSIVKKYVSDFDLRRDAPVKGVKIRKPSSTRKYYCPMCNMSVRATKEVRIKCFDCDYLMECDD